MRNAAAVATVVALVLSGGAYVACGGDDSAGGSGTGDDGGADGTAFDSGGGGDDTGSGGGDDTGSGGGDAGGGGDTGSDTGGGRDAAQDVTLAEGGGTVTDAGPGGDAAVVNCGTTSCNLPAQTCCFYPIEFPPPPYYSACANGATCPPLDAGIDAGSATEVKCETEANCVAGNVCCITATASGDISAHCEAPGSCVSTAGDKTAYLCDPSAADAGCGDAGACSSANIGTWHLPSGFATCGGLSR